MKDSTWIIGNVQERYKDAHEDKDWPSFYHGWIEGRFEALKPKPLEWDEAQSGKAFASTPIGMYVVGVTFTGDVFASVPLDLRCKYLPDISEAKAYCEGHFMNLILSLLKG